MSKAHHVIYITGLGDQKPLYQPQIINRWKKLGLTPHYHAIGWADGEAFGPKLSRLGAQVDELSANGDLVSLVGISAGAGAALNLYMARRQKITGIVFICGKLIGVDNVNPRYFQENPAFRESLELTQQNIAKLTDEDKAKMLSIRPIYDNVVPIKVMLIPGVKTRTILSALHVPSILLSISIYKVIWINFLKNQASVE
jgi:pimeloyl-ACP methyl ester carboxylesterase